MATRLKTGSYKGPTLTLGGQGDTDNEPSPYLYITTNERKASTAGQFWSPVVIADYMNSGATGFREALHVEQVVNGAGVQGGQCGRLGFAHLTSGLRSVFGLNGVGQWDSEVSANAECVGAEFDVGVNTSFSVVRKVGAQIVDTSENTTGAGSSNDAGLLFDKASTAAVSRSPSRSASFSSPYLPEQASSSRLRLARRRSPPASLSQRSQASRMRASYSTRG